MRDPNWCKIGSAVKKPVSQTETSSDPHVRDASRMPHPTPALFKSLWTRNLDTLLLVGFSAFWLLNYDTAVLFVLRTELPGPLWFPLTCHTLVGAVPGPASQEGSSSGFLCQPGSWMILAGCGMTASPLIPSPAASWARPSHPSHPCTCSSRRWANSSPFLSQRASSSWPLQSRARAPPSPRSFFCWLRIP